MQTRCRTLHSNRLEEDRLLRRAACQPGRYAAYIEAMDMYI